MQRCSGALQQLSSFLRALPTAHATAQPPLLHQQQPNIAAVCLHCVDASEISSDTSAAVWRWCSSGAPRLPAWRWADQSSSANRLSSGARYYSSTRSANAVMQQSQQATPLPQDHHHQQQQQQQQLEHQDPSQSWSQRPRRPTSRSRQEYQLPPQLAALVEAYRQRPPRPPPPPLEPRTLQFGSRRAGVVAIKAGMTQEWDEYGVRVPLTVLWVDDCQVVRVKHEAIDGTTSLVLGSGSKKPKQLHEREVGEFLAAGVPLKRKLWECPVSDDALLPPGTSLGAAHFVAGQELDVTGYTKGKGFQGVMKRHGFAGQGASHGNTKSHRRPGAIGGRTGQGKVWKGKKMPGRMGNDKRTIKNAWLYKVDTARNLLYVRGQVPGPVGSHLLLRDAFRWPWAQRIAARLPFPTALPPPAGVQQQQQQQQQGGEAAAEGNGVTVSPARHGLGDPYRVYREDLDYFEGKLKGE